MTIRPVTARRLLTARVGAFNTGTRTTAYRAHAVIALSIKRCWRQRATENLMLCCLNKLDRLGRDSLERERALRKLEFDGTRIVTSDGYDSSLPGHKMRRGSRDRLSAKQGDDSTAALCP